MLTANSASACFGGAAAAAATISNPRKGSPDLLRANGEPRATVDVIFLAAHSKWAAAPSQALLRCQTAFSACSVRGLPLPAVPA